MGYRKSEPLQDLKVCPEAFIQHLKHLNAVLKDIDCNYRVVIYIDYEFDEYEKIAETTTMRLDARIDDERIFTVGGDADITDCPQEALKELMLYYAAILSNYMNKEAT